MSFPYRNVFELVENSLIQHGSQILPREQIRAALDNYKTFATRELTDEQCFSILRDVVFYSGFLAATVDARMETIRRWLPDWRTVAEYGDDAVARMMADPGMIRNKRKLVACIENAKTMGRLIENHGSFRQYIASFAALDSFENLLLLKEELEARFHYLDSTVVSLLLYGSVHQHYRQFAHLPCTVFLQSVRRPALRRLGCQTRRCVPLS